MTSPSMNAEYVQKWFPLEHQRNYVSRLMQRGGINRRQAEYFVKLWAYLWLKQQTEQGKRLVQPLTELKVPQGWVSCTHREAAELFYGDKERGSDRAAGMMIDRLAALGLLEKQFDGNTTCILIISLPEPIAAPKPEAPVQVVVDDFGPRWDADPVATLMSYHYVQKGKDAAATGHKIKTILRTWAQQYPTGMRVLRRSDNDQPVGIYIVHPTAKESEEYFFLPPGKTRFFTGDMQNDLFKMAVPGDSDCTCVHLRAWVIDRPYMQYATVCRFVEDLQKTLAKMKLDFPNLCDLYSIALKPTDDELRRLLGFQKTYQDPQRYVYRIYTPVDRFLALNVKQALSGVKFQPEAKV